MSLIFAPGKYLTLIFLFLDIFFSLRPDIVDSPKISVVPFHHSSLFCCTVMLSALLVFFILDFLSSVNLFVRMLYGLPYFNHRAVLSFRTAGRLMFGKFINYNILHQMVYLKKPSTALLQTGVLSSRIIGEGFLLLNSFSVEPSLNGVVLVGNFFSVLVQLSHHLIYHYSVFQWF